MSDKIRFELDGREVLALPGETIWQVAEREGVKIPHLCYLPEPGYRPDGNCRVCMVEIEGERVLAPSCLRQPTEGMKVRAGNERATKARAMVMELLVADQPKREAAHDEGSRLWQWADRVGVVEIDPAVADTAAMAEAYDLSMDSGANCVVVAGRRGGDERVAACLVRADTRADVNNVVRRLLDVRKATFLSMERAVEESGMEYGGITPVGLPEGWRLLVDSRVPDIEVAVIGSGVRRSKLLVPGALAAELPGAEVVEGLAR